MKELEQELRTELATLRTAVSYIETANQRTAEALEAAAATQACNDQLQQELQTLRQRLDRLDELASVPAVSPQWALAGVGGLLLLGAGSWLWRGRN